MKKLRYFFWINIIIFFNMVNYIYCGIENYTSPTLNIILPGNYILLEYQRLLETVNKHYPEAISVSPYAIAPSRDKMLIIASPQKGGAMWGVSVPNRLFIYDFSKEELWPLPAPDFEFKKSGVNTRIKDRFVFRQWSPSGNQVLGKIMRFPDNGGCLYYLFLTVMERKKSYILSLDIDSFHTSLLNEDCILTGYFSDAEEKNLIIRKIERANDKLRLPEKIITLKIPEDKRFMDLIYARDKYLYFDLSKNYFDTFIYQLNIFTGEIREVFNSEKSGEIQFSPSGKYCSFLKEIYDITTIPWKKINEIPYTIQSWWDDDKIIINCGFEHEKGYLDTIDNIGALISLKNGSIKLENLPLLFRK